MALIIEGDMPTCCYDREKDKYCLFWNCRACRYGDTRPSDCPIIGEIPDEHGRLIAGDALKACPFCGGKAYIKEESDCFSFIQYVARCKNCLVEVRIDADMTKSFEYNRQKVTEAWNKRVDPWHTGTPAEEGGYVVWMRLPTDCVQEEYGSLLVKWDKERGFLYDNALEVSKIGEVLFWMPITPPFEANKEN